MNNCLFWVSLEWLVVDIRQGSPLPHKHAKECLGCIFYRFGGFHAAYPEVPLCLGFGGISDLITLILPEL